MKFKEKNNIFRSKTIIFYEIFIGSVQLSNYQTKYELKLIQLKQNGSKNKIDIILK